MKRRLYKKVYVLWALVLTFFAAVWTGCDEKDTLSVIKGDPLLLSANIQMMGGGEAYKLNGGESVGLWVSSTEGALAQADVAQNIKFYQSAVGLVSEPRTYTGGHQDLYIYGYYPFDTAAVAFPEAYQFSVEADQRSAGNVVASDLLWTKKTASLANGNEKILLDFSHLMSKLVINVRGSYPEVASLRECAAQIMNVVSEASVDLKVGSVSPSMTRANIEAMPLVEVADNYESSLQAVVVPQTFVAGEPLLKVITRGNVENEWIPQQDIVLGSGMQLVLDVLIEEKECVVTIKEIAPWEVDDEILYADAIEKNPSYELFDFYSRFGVQGIVIALDEGTEGQHGWLISTDEAELAWASGDVSHFKYNTFSRNDAAVNLKLALQDDPTLEKFPAMKWCDDKNQTRTTLADLEENGIDGRWVLLPVNELKSKFGDEFLAYAKQSNYNRLNTAIENASVPASQKVKIPEIDWSNIYFMVDYWSSTHFLQNIANMMRCAVEDHVYQGGSGVFSSNTDATTVCRVRAFYHF